MHLSILCLALILSHLDELLTAFDLKAYQNGNKENNDQSSRILYGASSVFLHQWLQLGSTTLLASILHRHEKGMDHPLGNSNYKDT
jgi:hypothetical protein